MQEHHAPGLPPKKRSYVRLGWCLLALAPLPLGLLTLNIHRLTGGGGTLTLYEKYYWVIVALCCVAGSIGMLPHNQRDWGRIGLAIVIGIFLATVEGFILVFVGCCVNGPNF